MGIVKKISKGFTAKDILNNQLFRHSIVYVLAIIAEKAIPFLLLPIMVTYLSTTDYGILQNYIGLQQILMAIVGLGVAGAIGVSYYKNSREENAENVTNVLVWGVVSILVLFTLITLFNGVINRNYNLPYFWQLIAVAHSFAAFIFLLYTGMLRLEKRPVSFGIINILKTLAEFSISIYLIVVIGMKWDGRIIGMLISFGSFSVICMFLLYRKGYLIFKFKKKVLWDLLMFGLPLIPFTLSQMLRTFLDKGFITHFEGIDENGVVGLAMNFGMLMYVVTFAFSSTFNPTLYEKLSHPQSQTKGRLVRIIYLYSLLLLILTGLLYLLSRFFIIRFIKPEWIGAIPYIFWILLSFAFNGIQTIVSQFIYFAKRTKVLASISITVNLFHIILSYFAIQWLGTIGIIYVLCLSSFAGMAVTWVVSNRIYPMPWVYKKS